MPSPQLATSLPDRSPQGCQLVAGGRSVSADHRIAELEIIGTLKGWETLLVKLSHPLQGANGSYYAVPVVFATLRPPATLSQPFGLQPSSHNGLTSGESTI